MARATVKNWDQFQHYKDRSPPWLKLHRGLLDNMEYALLSPEAGKALPLIWLIASEFDGGLPEIRQLAFRLRCDEARAEAIQTELVAAGFLWFGEAEPAEQAATPAERAGWGKRHISDKVKREAWARDNGKCVCCESVQNIEYDHIVPVSLGGSSELSNIQLLCRTCNRRKRASLATPAQPPRSLETETEEKTEKEADARPARTRKREQSIADWLASLPAGDEAIPADDPVFAYAAKIGLPSDYLALAWSEFEARHVEKSDKTYKDWRSAFRKCVRENWYRLWWEKDGAYALTTAGVQAQRAAA